MIQMGLGANMGITLNSDILYIYYFIQQLELYHKSLASFMKIMNYPIILFEVCIKK